MPAPESTVRALAAPRGAERSASTRGVERCDPTPAHAVRFAQPFAPGERLRGPDQATSGGRAKRLTSRRGLALADGALYRRVAARGGSRGAGSRGAERRGPRQQKKPE